MWRDTTITTHAGPSGSGYLAKILRRMASDGRVQYAFQVVDARGSFVGQPEGPFWSVGTALAAAHLWGPTGAGLTTHNASR